MFYSYFFIILILIPVAFLGVLNLTKDIVVYNLRKKFLETYISYLFENLENYYNYFFWICLIFINFLIVLYLHKYFLINFEFRDVFNNS